VFGGQNPAAILPPAGIDAERSADLLAPVAGLLGTVITGIFQQHSRMESLENRQETQQREIRLGAAFEGQASEGVLVLDGRLRIQRLNPAAEGMMGYLSAEVSGEDADKVLIGPEALPPALQDALEGSPTYNLGNVRLYRRNGESFLALMRIFPIVHAGRVEHVLVLVQDLTEQEQIRIQTQQLEHRALLGEVTAVFAHEVRNPINNISTGLQVMAMNLPPEDANQASVARMLADCDRLAELFKSVLAYSRPMDYEMEPLEVGVLLRRLLERLHPRILRQSVQYSLQVEDGCPSVQGNLRALEQVFNNLIGNALQAMGENGGHLIIKARRLSEDGQRHLEISIADTGPGIPRENLERVFQPFFTTEKGGTGLGLAIVKRIVTAHKGNITVTSFPGGTIFRVKLPVDES
jgi:PAS domain S-box-containing protein